VCSTQINCDLVKDASVTRLMKVFDETSPYSTYPSPLDLHQAYSGDVNGQPRVVVMPTAGAPSSAVVYLCPPGTYRQWVLPTSVDTRTTTSGPLVVGGGDCGGYAVTAWPLVTNASYASDRRQTMATVPAVPYTYCQQPSTTNITSNQCLIPQTVGVQHHHEPVVQSLNPTDLIFDQSADNPLVASTK